MVNRDASEGNLLSERVKPNAPGHRLPSKPRPCGFIPNCQRAAIRCTGWLALASGC